MSYELAMNRVIHHQKEKIHQCPLKQTVNE